MAQQTEVGPSRVTFRMVSAFPEVVWSTNGSHGDDARLLFRLGTTPQWDGLPVLQRIQIPDGNPVTSVRDVLSAALTGPASS